MGSTLRVVLLGASGKPVGFRFHVAGIDAAPGEFPPQYGTGIDVVWATPAFFRQDGRDLFASPAVALRLRHGSADVPVVEREISRLSGGKAVNDYPLGPQATNTARSIRLQAVVLWLLAGALAVLALLILSQLLARLSFLESASFGALRAVGMSRAQLAAAGLLRAAAIGAAAALLTVLLAVAASPLFPVGLARIAEPDPGIDADGLALGLGMIGVVVATVLCGAWPAWQTATAFRPAVSVSPRLATSVIVRSVRPIPAATGIGLALRRGAGRTALPVPSTIAGAALGLTALSAAVVFTASLGHLLATPRLYGVSWNALVASAQSGNLRPAASSIAGDPRVAQWSGTYLPVPVEIRGVPVGAITTGPGPDGSLAAVPLQGRPPQQADDIVLGERTLAAVHARIGDTVSVSIAGFRRRVRMRIGGTAVFPAMGDTFELGTGAELTVRGLRRLAPPGLPFPAFDGLMVRFRPGSSPARDLDALSARMDRLGPFQVEGSSAPTDLVNFGQVQALPLLLGLSLGVLALSTIVHLLFSSVRRRRRDLAVLRVIGFTRRQARATVAWQAIALTGVALVIGIPVGIACSRLAWQIFAGQLGIVPVLDVPVPTFAVLVAAVLAVAVAVAAVPGEWAARARPAAVLRAE